MLRKVFIIFQILIFSTITINSDAKKKSAKTRRIGGIEFVYIKGGNFLMGSPKNRGYNTERPRHKVTVEPLWIGKFEITQSQYRTIMGKNPSLFKGRKRPVEQVSWYDAKKFCEKFSKKYGVKIRLPYEAEWEYSCKAGRSGNYYWGKNVSLKHAWFNLNSNDESQNVGTKKPNKWKLYDMSGNVSEWCLDNYRDDYYKNSIKDNPHGPENGNGKVIRGGSWFNNKYNIRSAFRTPFNPKHRYFYIGFRVVMPVK